MVSVLKTTLPGVLVLEPRVFGDERGYFLESYNEQAFAEAGIRARFVQDNHSYSRHNVVRGIHYQVRQPQGKLVRVVSGEIRDVAVDLRRDSPTFGKWLSVDLSDVNMRILWIPQGCAHGFQVLSATAHVLYKATNFYSPECERTILWNDPDLNIGWEPFDGPPIISAKDGAGSRFRDAYF